MYGSVYKMRVKPGKEQDLIKLMEEWDRERRPKVKGARGGIIYRLDKGGVMGVAVFDSKADYEANANSSEQDATYRRMRELLEADPEWNDGEVISQWGSL